MVRVEVPVADVEVAADLLWAAGASAVGEEPSGDQVRLTADLDECPASVADRWTCVATQDDGAWWDGWRPFAKASRAGRFVVRPPWVPAPEHDGPALEIVVDPGRSFGTGTHPSTLLVLAIVSAEVTAMTSALDVGCGSGILAIGCATAGARRTVAIDVDPEALRATTANAARNGVAARIDVSDQAVDAVAGRFDLVLANLGSPLVVDLAASLSERLAPGGTLVLSGMLADRWEHVPAAYPSLRPVATPTLDGWRAVVLRHPESGATPSPS